MSDTSSVDEVARSSLAKTLENNIGPYLKTVKNLIVDTKLANDPSQDNFIKCNSLTRVCLKQIIIDKTESKPQISKSQVQRGKENFDLMLQISYFWACRMQVWYLNYNVRPDWDGAHLSPDRKRN